MVASLRFSCGVAATTVAGQGGGAMNFLRRAHFALLSRGAACFSLGVTGTIINAAAILLGGLLGLIWRGGFSRRTQEFVKFALGTAAVFFGVQLTWISLNGSFLSILRQLAIVILALMLGGLTGKLFRLQKASNCLGRYARERMAAAKPGVRGSFSDGFTTCALLFCVAPLATLGALTDGLSGYYSPLVVKATMDGMATLSFVAIWGWGAMLSALPVFAFQGTISLVVLRYAEPFLQSHGLVNPVNATAGLLIFCVGLLIYEARRIEVANYLPSLFYAPLVAWWLL
jgi:uncharacterized protein